MTGATVIVCKILGFSGWGEGFFGKGVVVRTTGLVGCRTDLVAVVVIMGDTVVVIGTRGFCVVFGGVVFGGVVGTTGGWVVEAWDSEEAEGVGTAGRVETKRRM